MTRWRQLPMFDESNTEDGKTMDDDTHNRLDADAMSALSRLATARNARVRAGTWHPWCERLHDDTLRAVVNKIDNAASMLAMGEL